MDARLLTDHARTRMQQRGIPTVALEVLLDFGRERHVRDGRRIVSFDKRTRRRVARALGPRVVCVERFLNAYAVLGSDDAVVTVGHRYRRFEHL